MPPRRPNTDELTVQGLGAQPPTADSDPNYYLKHKHIPTKMKDFLSD